MQGSNLGQFAGIPLIAAIVAATGQWTHPLSLIGYILGGLILLLTLAVFVGWNVEKLLTILNF